VPKKEQSLIYAYILDGKGGGRKLDWKEVEQWTPDQGLLWVHLNYTATRSIRWINRHSPLDKIAAKAIVTEESRPRAVPSAESLLVFLRGVNLNPGQDPEDMVSIRIWLNHHCIITTRKRRLLSVEDMVNMVEMGNGPKSPSEFLITLNERLTQRMSDVIDNIDEQVGNLEEEVISQESRLLRPKIAELRRQCISIRRFLAPQREALNKLYSNQSPFLTPEDRLMIRETTDRVQRYIEDLDSARERAAITQEELASRLSEQLDKRMYMLSLVAVVFLPLGFITGLLGINVAGMPGTEDKFAFWWVCILLGAIFIGIVGFLRSRKWM
tara:strand:+ start:20021 stop:20998 length:978 start_codon:yes stop_codon:yes gene_type:complete